ncbi:hypothetical protein EVAR_37734_1, partial [Eumeta japonica]
MSKPLDEREKFWADVRDILVKCDRNERMVIVGGFNSWVGVQRDEYEKVLGVKRVATSSNDAECSKAVRAQNTAITYPDDDATTSSSTVSKTKR